MQTTPCKALSAKLTRILSFFLCFYASSLHAEQSTLHEQLSQQARDYVLNNIYVDSSADVRVRSNTIDSRIDIPHCEAPFAFFANDNSLQQSNVSVKISCPVNNWYLFTMVQVMKTQPVVVTLDMLSPGALLTKDNVQLADIAVEKLRGSTFDSIDTIIGARLKRRLRPGQILNSNMLCFVCKGDRVTIKASAGGLSIKAFGIAKQDGSLGDTIRVENSSSKKLVSAVVANTNEVTINI